MSYFTLSIAMMNQNLRKKARKEKAQKKIRMDIQNNNTQVNQNNNTIINNNLDTADKFEKKSN